MADNVAITAGAGTSIAADDISSVWFQRMKLALGQDGTHTADAAGRDTGSGVGALYVDPRPKILQLQLTPVVSSGVAYSSGDCMGPITTLSSVGRISGGAARLHKITVANKVVTPLSLDFMFFDRAVTTAADNAAYTISDADAVFFQGHVNIPVTVAVPGWTTATALNTSATLVLPQPLPVLPNASDLFVQVVTRTAVTFGSTSDIVFTYWFEQL
jgi:hypothetical protein